MCGTSDILEDTDWRQEPPDSPGEWLWICQWDCGCVLKTGIAWVPEEDECPDVDEGMVKLPCGLYLSWEGQNKHYDLDFITAWRKINLPPRQWAEEGAF